MLMVGTPYFECKIQKENVDHIYILANITNQGTMQYRTL